MKGDEKLIGRTVKVFEDPLTEEKLEFEGRITVVYPGDEHFIHAYVQDNPREPDGGYFRRIRRDGVNFR